MHDPAPNRIKMHPRAEGTLSRLAIERAKAAGIDVTPLMVKAGVTRQQIEEEDVSLAAQGQIKLVELIADALQDDLLGFHLARDVDLRELGLLYYVLNSSDLLGDALRVCQSDVCAFVVSEIHVIEAEGLLDPWWNAKYGWSVGVIAKRFGCGNRNQWIFGKPSRNGGLTHSRAYR